MQFQQRVRYLLHHKGRSKDFKLIEMMLQIDQSFKMFLMLIYVFKTPFKTLKNMENSILLYQATPWST